MSLEYDIYDLMQPIITGNLAWADQNSPRQSLPYCTIKLTSMRFVNQDHYSDVDNAGIQTVLGDREFTLNVQSYGRVNGVEFLNGVVNKLRLSTNIDKFMAKKLTAFNTAQVQDISTLLDDVRIESRATLDVFCRMKSTLTDNVGIIDTVNIEANDDSNAGQYEIIAIDI